jgi:hypothetical protein
MRTAAQSACRRAVGRHNTKYLVGGRGGSRQYAVPKPEAQVLPHRCVHNLYACAGPATERPYSKACMDGAVLSLHEQPNFKLQRKAPAGRKGRCTAQMGLGGVRSGVTEHPATQHSIGFMQCMNHIMLGVY